jgi:hypothetical protein
LPQDVSRPIINKRYRYVSVKGSFPILVTQQNGDLKRANVHESQRNAAIVPVHIIDLAYRR